MKSENILKYPLLENIIKNFEKLTFLQKSFFQIMHSTVNTGGCLLITGDPGVGKTAIIREMCKKLKYQYIDIRLSQKDESEVGLYPKVDTINGIDCVKEIPPYWAIKANQRPTIVVFEELNRARREIQNAALQILMEREIGHNFSFNNNVYFIATSNMEDSYTETFSTAMRGRLIQHVFNFDFDYWVQNYAKANVNPVILEWLYSNKDILTEGVSDEDDLVPYLSPRSISAYSKSLEYAIEDDKDIENIIKYTENNCIKFIGTKSYNLLEFLRKWTQINSDDILNGFDRDLVIKLNREHVLYLIDGLKSFIKNNITTNGYTEKHKHENIIKFLKINNGVEFDIIDQDIIVGFIDFIFENCNYLNLSNKEHLDIVKMYKSNFSKELNILEKSKISQIL